MAVAAAPAHGKILAGLTFSVRPFLRGQKACGASVFFNLLKSYLIQISQAVRLQNEKVTGIYFSIGLNYILDAAEAVHITGFCPPCKKYRKIIIELPDINLLSFLEIIIPQIEKPAEKLAVVIWG